MYVVDTLPEDEEPPDDVTEGVYENVDVGVVDPHGDTVEEPDSDLDPEDELVCDDDTDVELVTVDERDAVGDGEGHCDGDMDFGGDLLTELVIVSDGDDDSDCDPTTDLDTVGEAVLESVRVLVAVEETEIFDVRVTVPLAVDDGEGEVLAESEGDELKEPVFETVPVTLGDLDEDGDTVGVKETEEETELLLENVFCAEALCDNDIVLVRVFVPEEVGHIVALLHAVEETLSLRELVDESVRDTVAV